MSGRYVAVSLKVPDNTAFTALVALQRLGVPVERVERALLVRAAGANDAAILDVVAGDESVFNPNLHRLEIRESGEPLGGELWVREDGESRVVAWRLFGERERPVEREILERARDVLLCNPAFESAELPV
jgi:hypothetical protein